MNDLPPAQYRALVEAAPTMIWRAGIDAKCDYFNETWLAYTGRTLDQERGEGWAEGVHPDDLQACVDHYLVHFERREPFEMEYRLRRHDGVYRWIFDRGAPFHDESGAFAGFIGHCIDVHERRVADEAKATFLAMLAHELRTPLQSLVFYATSVKRAAERGQPLSLAVAQRVDRQLGRLRRLVAHASGGIDVVANRPIAIEPAMFDLVQTVQAAIDARSDIAAPEVTFSFEVEGPRQPFCADDDRIAQVLDILLDNAVKYSPHDGHIWIKLIFPTASDDNLRIQVMDEGLGVPEDELARIGAPFFRASNTNLRQHPGLGLGLAIAWGVARAHGGWIEVAHRAPRGTAMSLVLPAKPAVPLPAAPRVVL